MPRPPDWRVDSGLRTAGSTQYEPLDEDGCFGDERIKLREVEGVLKKFAPASAYHGDKNIAELGSTFFKQKTAYEILRSDWS
eukprot:COSAG01_NODE_44333_length_420_cov_0.797508_2_plen_81_part_01